MNGRGREAEKALSHRCPLWYLHLAATEERAIIRRLERISRSLSTQKSGKKTVGPASGHLWAWHRGSIESALSFCGWRAHRAESQPER